MARTIVPAPVSSIGKGHTELVPFAQCLKLPFEGGSSLPFSADGHAVTVSLTIDSGAVVGVVFEVRLDGPPRGDTALKLTLRSEERFDRLDKERGISDEVQLGDAAFDPQVYIDSNATELEVRRFLGDGQLRSRVRQVITDRGTISVDAQKVELSFRRTPESLGVATMSYALETALALAVTAPLRGRSVPQRGKWAPRVLGLLVPVSFITAWVAHHRFEAPWWFVGLTGGATAAAVGLSTRGLVQVLVAGDSGSGRRSRGVQALLWLHAALLGSALAVALNADFGARRTQAWEEGTVLEVGNTEGDDGRWQTRIHWDSGATERYRMGVRPVEGGRVIRRWRQGRFVSWGEGVWPLK